MTEKQSSIYWPQINRAPAVPVTLVCGPPAGGKSTYVEKHAAQTDVVIDLDQIIEEMGHNPHTADDRTRHECLEERNRRLTALADERNANKAWFVTGAAAGSSRERWSRMLRADQVLVFLTSKEECFRRISSDPSRRLAGQAQCGLVEKWYQTYYPSKHDMTVS